MPKRATHIRPALPSATVALLALVATWIPVRSLAETAGAPITTPTPLLSSVAGRSYDGGEVFLAELRSADSRIVRLNPEGRVLETVDLEKTSVALDAFGLARSADGLLWMLADRGAALVGFEPTRGRVADVRPLPTNCIAVWSVDGIVFLAALRTSGDQPVLLRMNPGGFESCGALRSRPPKRAFDGPILGVLTCGASRTPITPCWWMAGDPELILLRSSCASKRVPVPSLVTRRSAAQRGSDPLDQFDYPIRDAFLIDETRSWILTNQEGTLSPSSERGTTARHLLLVTEGGVARTVPLARKGKLILGGDSRSVTILYADGTFEKIPLR